MNEKTREIILKWVERAERRNLTNILGDRAYLKMMFYLKMGSKLDLKNPKTFNEKLQWLKLYDRKPEYTRMVDKYEAKKYVAERIGEEYIIPTLGVWDSFDEINFDNLPDQFVLKCTHDSGGLVICRDKGKLDIEKARTKINLSLKHNYYWHGREWPYKNVKPRIIAEKYMTNDSGGDLRDYKFFCFGGMAKCMKVDFDRFTEHHANYFDREGNLLKFGEVVCPPVYERNLDIPQNVDEMREFAEKLSTEQPFLRADFYDVNGKVYFGELTFYPASGLGRFTEKDWDSKLGEWIELPKSIGGGYRLRLENYVFYIFIRSTDVVDNALVDGAEVNNETEKIKKPDSGLTDYKFYCFNGEPKYLYVSEGLENHATAKISFLTLEWNFAPFGRSDYEAFQQKPTKPEHFNDMCSIAKRLSEGHDFVRVDLYEVNGKVYFSEITFFPCSGFMPFAPEKWNLKLGEKIKLTG